MLLINFQEIILYIFRSRNCQWPIIITTLEPLPGFLKQFSSRTAPLLEYYLIYLRAPRMLCLLLRCCIMEASQTCSELGRRCNDMAFPQQGQVYHSLSSDSMSDHGK
jgi:hypothetical protein